MASMTAPNVFGWASKSLEELVSMMYRTLGTVDKLILGVEAFRICRFNGFPFSCAYQ